MDILAAILFGPPGPVQRRVFRDSVVQAEIRYRIAPDRLYDSGPAAVSPSISAGTLSVVVGGQRRTYDLSAILPLREARILLPEGSGDCGATQPLTRRGNYLAIEVVVAQKGCSVTAAFVDLKTGQVAESAVLDHRWDRRFLAVPEEFSGENLRVTQAELATLTGEEPTGTGKASMAVPWTFGLIHALDARGATHLVSFPTGGYDPGSAAGSDVLPKIGSTISVGSIVDHGDLALIRQMGTERVIHWTAADDARYAALQSPTPARIEQIVRYNFAFSAADEAARQSRFDDAVRLLAVAVSFGVDPSSADMLRQCRVLASDVHMGHISAAAAGAEFPNGCLPAQ